MAGNGSLRRCYTIIMLRFRPILPKPAATEAALSFCSENAVVPKRRTKRNYVRVRRSKRERPCSPEMEDDAAVVTLQLFPEKGEPEQASLAGDSWCKKNVDLNLNVEKFQIMDNHEHLSVTPESWVPATVTVESWVTVESVRGTCGGEGGWLGRTDAEKVKCLDGDTCPGFISDGNWRLQWVNDAYKRMVMSEWEKEAWPEMVIWLKVKNNSVLRCCYSYPSFTCSVRLQYTWRNEKCTKMVPCDVWRLDCGGFAWRLDVKAALSLGL